MIECPKCSGKGTVLEPEALGVKVRQTLTCRLCQGRKEIPKTRS